MKVVYACVLNVFATSTLMIKVSCTAEILIIHPPIPSLCAEGLAARILPKVLQERWWFILKKQNEFGLSSVSGF